MNLGQEEIWIGGNVGTHLILRCCCIEFVAHMVRIFEWVGEALLCFNSDMDGIVASSLLMLFFLLTINNFLLQQT